MPKQFRNVLDLISFSGYLFVGLLRSFALLRSRAVNAHIENEISLLWAAVARYRLLSRRDVESPRGLSRKGVHALTYRFSLMYTCIREMFPGDAIVTLATAIRIE